MFTVLTSGQLPRSFGIEGSDNWFGQNSCGPQEGLQASALGVSLRFAKCGPMLALVDRRTRRTPQIVGTVSPAAAESPSGFNPIRGHQEYSRACHVYNSKLAFIVGRTEVMSAKRHENGTRVPAGLSECCKRLKRMAPQAGVEPATLRLTAGFRSSCWKLPGVAACCCL